MNDLIEEKIEREFEETGEMFDPNEAVGMTTEAAAEWFKGYGYLMRVAKISGAKISGAACIVTRDHRLNRINVAAENGKVIDVLSVG